MTTAISTQERLVTFTTKDGRVFSIEGKKFVSRKPAGMREGYNEALACQHRDVSVCDECIATYANVVDIIGECYWVRNYDEWLELISEIVAIDVEYAK